MIDPIASRTPTTGPPLHLQPGASAPGAKRGPAHLGAVDVVRFLTVAGVIAVHSTSLTQATTSLAGNAVLDVLHVTRSVFLLLSAFVLGYSFLRRPLPPRAFWRRRYPLVAAPYVVWSAIYVVADGHWGSPAHVVGTFALDLLDGGAHFHLYFLLLTFQLYLVFPALITFFRRHPSSQVPVLVASATFELAFTAAVHYGWRPPVLGIWLDHPGSWLPSYELYVVGGVLAAMNFEALTAWVRAHGALILGAVVVSVAACMASYLVDLSVLGYAPVRASEVFQPMDVVEAVAVTLGQYALGLKALERLSARKRRFLRESSDVSFGVYLAHPLLVGGLLDVAAWIGLSHAVGTLPSGLIEVLVVGGLVPFVYAVTFFGISLVRRTPVTMWLTGRKAVPSGAGAPRATSTA